MNRWQLYKTLELIAHEVPEPQGSQSIIVTSLRKVWRSLSIKMIQNLSEDQRLEYLERCIDKCVAVERLAVDNSRNKVFWQALWTFLNQPVFNWNLSMFQEPQIQQIAGPRGQVWWQVHDPITGQTNYLESEEEVHIWLEERLYF